MSNEKHEITIPAQKYTLVKRGDSYVILDEHQSEVTGSYDIFEDYDPATAAEGMVDKLLSDAVPDAVQIDVGDLAGEITSFITDTMKND